MANPTLYKKTSLNDANNRTTQNLTSDEQTRVNTVISKFFELFTAKHS